MGQLFYDQDGHCDFASENLIKTDKAFCFNCGSKKPTGYWFSDFGIFTCVCEACALDVLPALLVDAIVAANQGRDGTNAGAILQEQMTRIITKLYQTACGHSSNSEFRLRAEISSKERQMEAASANT